MTITLQAVNELIASLENAGELSIREQKFLKLAKEFSICSASLDAAIKTGNMLADQNAQLAAENVEAKKIISECREYFIAGVMKRIRPTNEGYLHMICDTFADETPATDRVVAGIKADGVEEFIGLLQQHVDEGDFVGDEVAVIVGAIDCGKEFFEQLHEGADK
ncbi:hypothetical protein ACUBJ7_17410 [Klebsiella pneumoniae]|uniref:hypothetical protein n=1 Tax=Klebsiella pneumoniae TaxID=573 RepID=UPI0004A0BD06|nr:hypothetical protein [Klebsiella pneumoniae]KDL95221.1 hypothetical protein AE00_00295 [Klebsiella pneumoniae MGH 74]MCD5916988.1 hypothetical protein [Klebsiella pneumoniae]MCF6392087.1 hypothetical protein [Klebsiella pneumoniae]MCJ3710445.1 hypothetical protein [Klebsiella pneumoniae]MCS6683172.1 hypothetical protein [Klebsiella pneumoniae subsp. pneumoniae]